MVKARKKSSKSSNKTPKKNTLNFFGLKWFVRFAGVLLALQAYALLELSDNYAVPLVQSFAANPRYPLLTTVPVVSITLVTWTAFLLLVSAASYLVVSSTGLGWYLSNLKHNVNYMRWLHHSISTSLMIVIVSMLSGVNDILTVALIFIVSVAVNMFGLAMEVYNVKRKVIVWNAYLAGVFIAFGAWSLLLITFASVRLSIDRTLSDQLLLLYVTISAFLVAFAINMLLQYSNTGPWRDSIFAEKSYIVINVLTKSLFVWQIYAHYL